MKIKAQESQLEASARQGSEPEHFRKVLARFSGPGATGGNPNTKTCLERNREASCREADFEVIEMQARYWAQSTILAPSWRHLGPSWRLLGPSWRRLGPHWRHLGPSWRYLGAIWGNLGPSWAMLAPSWAILAPSWAILAPSWAHLGAILGPLGLSWGHLGAILGHLGAILGPSWRQLGPPWGHLGPGERKGAFSYGFGTLFQVRGWGLESKIPPPPR